jgi:hypothetical protein
MALVGCELLASRPGYVTTVKQPSVLTESEATRRWTQGRSGHGDNGKNPCSCPESDSDHPAHSQVSLAAKCVLSFCMKKKQTYEITTLSVFVFPLSKFDQSTGFQCHPIQCVALLLASVPSCDADNCERKNCQIKWRSFATSNSFGITLNSTSHCSFFLSFIYL